MDRRTWFIIIAASVMLFLGLLAWIFGGSDEPGPTDQPEVVTTGTTDSSVTTEVPNTNVVAELDDTVAIGDEEVTISELVFDPMTVTIQRGSMVKWTNNDEVQHEVVPDQSSDSFPKSEILFTGMEHKVVFNKTGTFPYHCSFHPSMTGVVVVTE